jgi:alternate F1F0 ATPase F1 subunit epsilon
MKLIVCTPLGEVLNKEVQKISLEFLNGYHTFLPKHIDFASVIKPSIATYTDETGVQKYIACHTGVAVKKGKSITLSVRQAVLSDTLDELKNTILREFKKTDEQRKELNTAMARLEIGLLRGFKNLKGGDFDGGI